MTKIYNLNVSCSEPLPTPFELLQQMPIGIDALCFIEEARQSVKNILDGVDKRKLLILGPCSIHNIGAAKEYALKLSALAKEVEEHFFLLMRVYVEKPRTTKGWKGLMYDPFLDGSYNIQTGIRWARQLFLEMAHLKVPVATEFLHPISPLYFGDLVTWGCIGARTSSSQIHRQMVSSLSFPTAFKNNTDGNVELAVQGVMAASEPQTFIGLDPMGRVAVTESLGNPYAHIVLRGGEKRTNYDPQSVEQALNLLESKGLPLRLIIDCSHGNSMRIAEQQVLVFESVIHQILEGNLAIKGLQIESNLKGGSQSFHTSPELLDSAVSLTDPCIDWRTTESMVLAAFKKFNQYTHYYAKTECQSVSH